MENAFIFQGKKENRKSWGEKTSIKEELKVRNENIFKDYESGISIKTLSIKYFLSEKKHSKNRFTNKKRKISYSIKLFKAD